VTERVASTEAASAAFRTLADAEGAGVPMYARLCRSIADTPELAALLLQAPPGQRLPVLLLAALHDVVLRDPEVPLAPWYPSVGGDAGRAGDLAAALADTVSEHRDRIVDLVRHRQVQTNEVNRSVAWRAALAEICHEDTRPLALVELGASAGLNLGMDRCRVEFAGAGLDAPVGPSDSPLHLATTVRSGSWPHLGRTLPRVAERVGVDQRPLDPTDPDDARWLVACLWPEQPVRLERLRAALTLAAADPPRLVRGDLVDLAAPLLDEVPDGHHAVVLSSWALAYVERARRVELLARLGDAAGALAARDVTVTLLTLEADHLLPWIPAPALPAEAPAEVRHASLLAATSFHRGEVRARALARCQAHLVWMDQLPG
jgi:hypothetical protein